MSNVTGTKMSLAELARSLKEFSPLVKGREKIETKDLLDTDLHIMDYDVISRPNETPFAVVIFQEYPDNFLFAGSVLTDLITSLAANIADLHKELSKTPLGIRMSRKVSKNKFAYTDIEIL